MAVPPQAAPLAAVSNQPSANAGMSMSAAGIAALRASEGQRNGGGYYDDVAHNCTRGTGILVHAGPCTAEELARPPDQANNEATFQNRLHDAEAVVRRDVTDRALTQDQFDALVSAAFNLGNHNVHPILHRANEADNAGVVRELRDYVFFQPRDRQGNRLGPLRRSQGLANRREREARPFLPQGANQ